MSGEEPLDLASIVEQLKPHIPGLIQTIGIAGSATTDDKGKVTPGDVKAASIGLDLVVKHLSGKGSSKIEKLLEGLAAASREDDEGTASRDRTDDPGA